jgi:hypothetical protein
MLLAFGIFLISDHRKSFQFGIPQKPDFDEKEK